MRFFAPVLFLGAAWYVHGFNRGHEQEKLLVPGLDLFPSLRGNLDAQAEWSPVVLAVLGAVLLGHALYTVVRDRLTAESDG